MEEKQVQHFLQVVQELMRNGEAQENAQERLAMHAWLLGPHIGKIGIC
jgi:hypothetical protein